MFVDCLKPNTCQPILYEREPASRGSRIGGTPPRGVAPRFGPSGQKYFGTVELDRETCVSIFYSFDVFGDDAGRDIISFNNRVLYPSEWIHAVVHDDSEASDESAVAVEVTCHRLTLQTELPEVETDQFSHSKLGGRPFVDNTARVGQAMADLLSAGYAQLAQFDTPHPRMHSFVEGFPWDPGWLHVFVRGLTFQDCGFAFVVQQ